MNMREYNRDHADSTFTWNTVTIRYSSIVVPTLSPEGEEVVEVRSIIQSPIGPLERAYVDTYSTLPDDAWETHQDQYISEIQSELIGEVQSRCRGLGTSVRLLRGVSTEELFRGVS